VGVQLWGIGHDVALHEEYAEAVHGKEGFFKKSYRGIPMKL
jgi:hypothetical protein